MTSAAGGDTMPNSSTSGESRAPQAVRATRDASSRERALERPPDNLPFQLTSFVGREREVAEVEGLLDKHRLVTLCGPGGSGKTRLALSVAFQVAEGFEDGVWLAELASLSDPDLVPLTVARVLAVPERPDLSPSEALAEALGERQLLLVLDNCEHLIEACARFAQTMLVSCPRLRVLATSREALGVPGEVAWSVPPLSLPDPDSPPQPEDLARYESARLFVERAGAANPSFALTEDDARAVARICRRLDGIPLAIELAAARAKVLSLGQIASRLEDSLGLLTAGSRTAPPRQRTLRATLEWSHELLAERERELFGRLSVFAGGWSLEAAEAVGAEPSGAGAGIEEGEVLDLLSGLVDKSMVMAEGGGEEGSWRYRMLEPVRQYALEKLEAGGGAETTRRRHAAWFLALAEGVEPGLTGPEQGTWLERLVGEHANFRAALSWALGPQDAQPEGERTQLGLRLATALGSGWILGRIRPGRRARLAGKGTHPE